MKWCSHKRQPGEEGNACSVCEAAALHGLVRTYDGSAPRPRGPVLWWFAAAPKPCWALCDGEDLLPGDRWMPLPPDQEIGR